MLALAAAVLTARLARPVARLRGARAAVRAIATLMALVWAWGRSR